VQLDRVGRRAEIGAHVGTLGVTEGAAAVEPGSGQGAQWLVVTELGNPYLVTGQQLSPQQVLNVTDLLQLHDPVVPLLERRHPLGEDLWCLPSDHPSCVVGALHVLALLHLGAPFSQGVDRLDRVARHRCPGLFGLAHLGAGSFEAPLEELPRADLAVADAADVDFHAWCFGKDLQPFAAGQFEIVLGEAIPSSRRKDRYVSA